MYTVTFYSFKGGVGRTMALTNVAVYLAQIGKRVLVVDFDLEAPGIDTLVLGPTNASRARNTPGVVDFVHEYLQGDTVPNVQEHVYEAPDAGRDGGRLWVMPAGRVDEGYAERLSHINWADLYEHQDGYVLFEDLKAQWWQCFEPDYVLIDSRTGMTDVGGICTRQLPDAVVLLFIPNEQNLRGLVQIVAEIRAEAETAQQKHITTHFVMSNVPDLDDEQRILERRERDFRRILRMKQPPTIIHHYDSLLLLNQAIFTRDRPRSRLSKEYQTLVARIRGENPEDAGGALDYLRRLLRTPEAHSLLGVEDRLIRIKATHPNNGELLATLARVRYRQGRIPEAMVLLQDALSQGYDRPSVLLQIAESYQVLGRSLEASETARRVFDKRATEVSELGRALEILRLTDQHRIVGVADTEAARSLEPNDAVWLADNLGYSRLELREARQIVERAIDNLQEEMQGPRARVPRIGRVAKLSDSEEFDSLTQQIGMGEIRASLSSAHNTLELCLIGLGEFDRACSLIQERVASLGRFNVADSFNLAMADWGNNRRPAPALFARVVELGRTDSVDDSPNYNQCLALSHWVLGDEEQASLLIKKSTDLIKLRTAPEFSCWRYLRVNPETFLGDLEEIAGLLHGEPREPRFFEAGLDTANSVQDQGERNERERGHPN
jgi:MinD-like ATPase involved in chromosome partitioning or flagellar assembly